MVRNALRKELAARLTAPEMSRAPVIRRSLKEEWLYTADLSLLYDGELPEDVAKKLSTVGWIYRPEGTWLQLRKTATEPPADWYADSFGAEASCCASLLRRHPERDEDGSEAMQYKLIKAAENGFEAYEAACTEIHRSWAERLRQGKKLTEISIRYFEI